MDFITDDKQLCLRIYKKDISNPNLFEKVDNIIPEAFMRFVQGYEGCPFIESEIRKGSRTTLARGCDIYAFETPKDANIKVITKSTEYKITKVIDSDELFSIPIVALPFIGEATVEIDKDAKLYKIILPTSTRHNMASYPSYISDNYKNHGGCIVFNMSKFIRPIDFISGKPIKTHKMCIDGFERRMVPLQKLYIKLRKTHKPRLILYLMKRHCIPPPMGCPPIFSYKWS